MKRNNFFANAASKALALAATVMMMSVAFTACSSSNNDDDGGGGTPPPPAPKVQTVTLDGVEKPILKAEYEDKNDGNYALYLYLSADGKEKVLFQLNKDVHMTGNPVKLNEKEKAHPQWYWMVEYYKPDGTTPIYTFADPDSSSPVFTTGTLTISGSLDGTINIKLENGRVKGEDGAEHTLTISYSGKMTKSGGGTTPTEEYVDLGLSVKWAKCNLGASKPSDYGDYYAWGETAPKAEYTWATYKWMQAGKSDWQYITKYTIADGQTEGIWYDAGGTFIGDNKTTLEAADDAATAKLGSPWRMPTKDEIQELIDNCTWTWTTKDGKNGYEVKGKNGNSIFLPAAGYRKGSVLNNTGSWGYFRSSSLYIGYNDYASNLNFDSDRHDKYNYSRRYLGFSVRPVRP